MSKVIDLVPHLKTLAKNTNVHFDSQPTEQILDFESERKKLLFQD